MVEFVDKQIVNDYNYSMKYVSCLLLESGMAFGRNDVKPCTPGYKIHWAEEYYGGPFDADKYLELRNKYVDMMKRGDIPEQCVGCSNLEEKDWPEEPGVEFIVIGNETKCSCNCYYCWFAEKKDYYNKFRSYDVMPILTALKEKNLLRHTTFDIVGGECTEYEEGKLQAIVDFVMENDYWLHFFSSGFFYSEIIAEAMRKSKANIVVSVDSGTKETYEKIKRVKTFDRVWENMAKYAAAGVQDDFCKKGYVVLKYIIIPGVNDNFDEFKEFARRAKESGCKWIRIAVEYNWWNENSHNPMPKNLFAMLDLIETYKKDFIIDYIENAIYLWQKRAKEEPEFTGVNPCIHMVGC